MKANNKPILSILIVFISFLSASTVYGQIVKNVEFKSNDLIQGSIVKGGTTYTYVQLKNTRSQISLGNPDLPVLHYRFYIPVNQKAVSVTFNSKSQNVIQLKYDLIPAQKPLLTSWNQQDTTFISPNKLVYGSSNAYPAMQARIIDTDYLDGDLELVNIEVSPMQYFPATKKIVYSSQFELKIETVADDNASGKKAHPKKRMREVMSILKSVVVNPELASADSSSIVLKSANSSSKVMAKVGASTSSTLPYYEYVVITDASLVSGFTDFVNWKKRKGINIGIVTTNDIYSNYTGDAISNPVINDNPGKVRQYLHDAHTNGPTTWALIAGDYDNNVPIRFVNYGEDIPTDSYFTDLYNSFSNGNTPKGIPDIYVGRLICSNTTDIQNWSKKVLLYEQNPGNGDYSYLLNAYHIEADEMQDMHQADSVSTRLPYFTHSKIGEYPICNATYDTNGQILTPSGYSGQYGTSKGTDVVAGINSHKSGLYSWFCHGGSGIGAYHCSTGQSGIGTMTNHLNAFGENGWGIYAQDAYEYCSPYAMHETGNGLDNLTNNNYPSILYSISCRVTPYNITTGNNNVGAMNCGEAFTKLPQTGGIAFLGNTVDGYISSSYKIYENFAVLINSDDFHSHIGVSECLSRYSYPDIYLAYSHNLIGCPETQMWTASPTKFSSATVTKNGTSVTVNTGSVSNCKICVISASDNGASYFQVDTLTSGKTFNNVPSSYCVTITKHNYIPYMYSSDYYIQNETYTGTQTINATNVTAGSNVTTSKPTGPVTIQSGANITIDADGTTIINDTFEVQTGAQFEIK